jgi:zinc/manganese transport system substrate-binding protein
MRTRAALSAAVVLVITAMLATACSSGSTGTTETSTKSIVVVAAENEYGDVAQQIGGSYVTVDSIMSNPATDPHTYEASQSVAQEVSQAKLILQNGVGYDTFMTTIENAAANSSQQVINVQHLLGLPDTLSLPGSVANPHLWYKPTTMPQVADAIASDLAAIEPQHAAYFKANAQKFTANLSGLESAISTFKSAHPGVPVATTEPVADYLLTALGANNLTPWIFQADIMNGVDPSPQILAEEKALFTQHKVKVFLYNQQVTSSLTESIISLAHANHIPVVGVYETMPEPGYDYQSWMTAEIKALTKAIVSGTSTEHL